MQLRGLFVCGAAIGIAMGLGVGAKTRLFGRTALAPATTPGSESAPHSGWAETLTPAADPTARLKFGMAALISDAVDALDDAQLADYARCRAVGAKCEKELATPIYDALSRSVPVALDQNSDAAGALRRDLHANPIALNDELTKVCTTTGRASPDDEARQSTRWVLQGGYGNDELINYSHNSSSYGYFGDDYVYANPHSGKNPTVVNGGAGDEGGGGDGCCPYGSLYDAYCEYASGSC